MLAYDMARDQKSLKVGARIRQAREAKGWSQEALADELDTEQATVARWESGTFPRRMGLPKIANALDKPVEWFLEDHPGVAELERRLAALENKTEPEIYVIPPDLLAAWRGASELRRSVALYFLTQKESYLDQLPQKFRKAFRSIGRSLGLKARDSGK